MPPPKPFVDHYEVLGGDPSIPLPKLRRLYFEKLKIYHPDKRQTCVNGLGHKVTQELNEAWSILSDPEKKETYDAVWYREKEKTGRAPPPQTDRPKDGPRERSKPSFKPQPSDDRAGKEQAKENSTSDSRAALCRHDGNELYKAAVALAKAAGFDQESAGFSVANMPPCALERYEAAIAKYTLGIELAPLDHRLYTNRALCYVALLEWTRCREDAKKATELKPELMKGWFLLVKAVWKEGSPAAASRELEMALRMVPDSPELLSLKQELADELKAGIPKRGREAPSKARMRSKSPSSHAQPSTPQQPPPPDFPPPRETPPRQRPSSSPPTNNFTNEAQAPRPSYARPASPVSRAFNHAFERFCASPRPAPSPRTSNRAAASPRPTTPSFRPSPAAYSAAQRSTSPPRPEPPSPVAAKPRQARNSWRSRAGNWAGA